MSKSGATQLIAVSQQPLNRIPQSQTGKQEPAGVLASVELKNDVLEFTLYSDTLNLAGQEVHVEPLTGDSLIIMIGGTQVAYKIPGGWGKGKSALKLRE